MNLKQWCDLDEIIYSSQIDEECKQYAGLDFKKEIIEQLAEMKISNSKIFIDFSHPSEHSIFLERLTKNSDYIWPLIDSGKDNSNNTITKLTPRNQFMELFFIAFYAANSLMKLEYWKEKLSVYHTCELYSRLITKKEDMVEYYIAVKRHKLWGSS